MTLIIDDFALQPLTPAQTTDFYEIITERHRRASTVVTSNRDASEWLPLMTDPLLAQSAIDRLTSTCHELIVEGDSYRRRQRCQGTSGLPCGRTADLPVDGQVMSVRADS